MPVLPRHVGAVLAAAAALALSACSSADDAGIDDMLDTGGASTGHAIDLAWVDPGQAWADAGITRRIVDALARDPALRPWRIDVDTLGGKVVLRGLVPTGPMRDRATRMALAVPGVTLVDSLLDLHS